MIERKDKIKLPKIPTSLPSEWKYAQINLTKKLLIDLKNYEQNNKIHPAIQKKVLKEIIEEVWYDVPIIIDKYDVIVAWHCRTEVLKLLWYEYVDVIIKDKLSEKQIRKYRLLDNKIAELAEDNLEAIHLELEALEDQELNELYNYEVDILDEDKEAIEDEVPEDTGNIIVEKWDIFQLGEHRLMCWDSTSIDDVEKLMNWEKAWWVWTDPPYNIAFKPQRGTHWEILNDNMDDEQFDKFLFDYLTCQSTFTEKDSVAIIWMWWSTIPSFQKNIEKLYKIKSMPIWYKNNFGIWYWTRPQYEPCFLCLKWEPEKPKKAPSDIWEYKKVYKTIHSCEKPVQLISDKINTFIKWSILDLFWWSWSTLIACEKTNRKCYMMELDEKYIQVILKRYYEYTDGKEIKCLNRALDLTEIYD